MWSRSWTKYHHHHHHYDDNIEWMREMERERERGMVVMMMMKKKKMKPKWEFIFQINEHGFGTQLLEEKGQKKDLTILTTHSFHPRAPSFPSDTLLIFSWLLIMTQIECPTWLARETHMPSIADLDLGDAFKVYLRI